MGTEVDVQRNPNTEFVDAFAKWDHIHPKPTFSN